MKSFCVLFLFLVSISCFSQQHKLDFAIYFGNDFRNDSVTIFANRVLIADNIKLSATNISPQNLIIIQEEDHLTVMPHHRPRQILKKVLIKNSMINLLIQMNNNWWSFKFDLKKGRFLYPEFEYLLVGWSTIRILVMSQDKQGPLML
jgi:hypothetical protein